VDDTTCVVTNNHFLSVFAARTKGDILSHQLLYVVLVNPYPPQTGQNLPGVCRLSGPTPKERPHCGFSHICPDLRSFAPSPSPTIFSSNGHTVLSGHIFRDKNVSYSSMTPASASSWCNVASGLLSRWQRISLLSDSPSR